MQTGLRLGKDTLTVDGFDGPSLAVESEDVCRCWPAFLWAPPTVGQVHSSSASIKHPTFSAHSLKTKGLAGVGLYRWFQGLFRVGLRLSSSGLA